MRSRTPAFASPFALICLLLASPAALADDLIQVYQQALQNDPLLLEAEANLAALREERPLARSGLLPTINLSGFVDDQDGEGTSSSFTSVGLLQTESPTDTDRKNWTLSLTQPLFRWDRWVALARADKAITQEEANYAAARQDLARRVTVRYFDVLTAVDQLEAAVANKEAIARQLEQAETRFDVGLIAITDVYESRAAYDQAVADEIVAQRTLATARESLREITFDAPGELARLDENLPLNAPEPPDAERWVERALAQNLSVAAGRLGVEIAADDIRAQRTGHYPTLDLVLSHNKFESDGTRFDTRVDPTLGTITTGGVSDTDRETDTIALQFSVPIYSGGAVSSRVRQAMHRKNAAQQRLVRFAREAERQTRDSYLGVVADISRVKALAQAVKSSETALEATQAGFDVGTRTSVDVLNARRDLLSSQTNFRRARYDYLVNLVALKQAAGTLTEQDIRQINAFLSQ